MKYSQVLILALALFLSSLPFSQPAVAQSTQNSYTVNLTYLTVQLSYPSEVVPGNSVTVNVQANSKNSYSSVSLAVQIYYGDGSSLHQLSSATLSSSSGSALSKQLQFTVPSNAPRTSLVALLTETAQTTYTSYYYYPVYYNYSSPYCYYDSYYGYYCNSSYYSSPNCYYDSYGNYYCTNYGYSGYSGNSYAAYPYNSYSTTSDSGVAPLSYIKATTPEYVSLQSDYQQLHQQYSQSQAENQQLKQNLQNAQNTIAEQNATIANLNQQLSTTQTDNGTLQKTAIALAIIALVFGAFLAHEKVKTKALTNALTQASTQAKP